MLTLNASHARSLWLVAAASLLTLPGPAVVAAEGTPPKPPASPAPAPVKGVAPAAPATAKTKLEVKLKSLEEWDTQVDQLMRVTEQVYSGQSSEDLGGNDLEYYWHRYVLTSDTKDKLESLRDQAQKQSVAKDTAGLQRTLDEASAILTAEHTKGYIVVMFLTAQAPVIYHQYQLGPWLARATDADRQNVHDRVTAVYGNLSAALDEAIEQHDTDGLVATSQRFYKLIAEPVAFFNAERARLVQAQAQLPNPIAVPARARGDKPCPAPVPPVKGRDKPGLAPNFPSSESFYPAQSRQNDVEGSVTLRVKISETGCIQQAEVAGTSGVARLDDSALDLAMAGSYVPADGAGGKPTAGSLMFRVKFEQPDPFGAAP